MTENYEHYITRNIQAVYRRRLIPPALYLIASALLWFLFPLPDILFPAEITSARELQTQYRESFGYVQATLTDLYFTGYTSVRFGRTNGYYYYTVLDGTCVLVLLSPITCEEGLPYIDTQHIRGRIVHQGDSYQALAASLAEDLSWTAQGLKSKVSPYILSEPDLNPILTLVLLILLALSGMYALISLILSMTYILFPVLSPPCRQLGRFGRPSLHLAQAEEELAKQPHLATEDMFITEHYFIEIASFGIAIVPIREMIWIYKYSTLHKFFWYHFNISYTLYITLNKHVYIKCPKNIKSDIDGIIDYLAEANHNTLVGFSEENRLKVQELQGTSRLLERIVTLLKRRF